MLSSPGLAVGLGLLLFTAQGTAATFAEIGDAPALGGQVASGVGTLDAITGTLSDENDVDVFRFRIDSPATFRAETFSPLDSQLFLFNSDGIGIAANDDQSASLDAGFQAGDALYSTLPVGEYLLAISAFDVDPTAQGALIFPNTAKGFLGPVGATGPGAAFAVDDWATGGLFSGNYRIELIGVAFVPEPETLPLCLAGLVALALQKRATRRLRQNT
jgi:hypothetical protein